MTISKIHTYSPLFSRRFLFRRTYPRHFTFSRLDIYKSFIKPESKHIYPHWTKYPLLSTKLSSSAELKFKFKRLERYSQILRQNKYWKLPCV